MHLLGRFSEAVAMQQSLIADLSNKEHPDMSIRSQWNLLINAMYGLASNFCSLQEFQKSMDISNEAITKYGQDLDPDEPVIVGLRELICLANLGLGKTREGDVLVKLEAVYESRKKTHGNSHPNTLIAMDNVAKAYTDLKLYKQSWDLQQRCVQLMKESLGPDHPMTKYQLDKLAQFPEEHRRPRAWRRLALVYREEVLEKMTAELGLDAPMTLGYMSRLAMELYVCGMPQKALDVQERVVKLLSTASGEEQIDIGREREDLDMMRKAVKIRKVVHWMLPGKGLGTTK